MKLVLGLVAIVVLGMTANADPKPKPKPNRVDWTARAKAVTWSLDRDATILDYARAVTGYDVVMIHDGTSGGFGDLELRIESKGKAIYSWDGHRETPLVVDGDVLYFSDHSPIATGATIVAVDLKTGKEKWRTALKGIGPVDHSKYRNQVKIEIAPGYLTVQGEEAEGSYVELVDRKTGKTLANDKRSRAP